MNEFCVPTMPLRVSVWLTDGRTLEGDVFLPTESPVRDGPMLPAEWANLSPVFVPVRPADGGAVILVSRNHVSAFALPPGVPADAPEEFVDAPVLRVVVEMAGGPRFEGRIAISTPYPQRRLKDLVNTRDAYLTLDVDGRAHLIRKDNVIRMLELGGS